MPGEDLKTYMSKGISRDEFYELAMAMIKILMSFHKASEGPFLNPDLKVEEFLVSKGNLSIVDLGGVVGPEDKGRLISGRNQTAPELREGQKPTVRSDIYSLGLIFREMYAAIRTLVPAKESSLLRELFDSMTNEEANLRVAGLSVLEEEIRAIRDFAYEKNSVKGRGYKYGVVGTGPKVGTTHVAVSLTASLNKMGKRSRYYEPDEDGWVLNSSIKSSRNRMTGSIKYEDFRCVASDSPGVSWERSPEDISVKDLGCGLMDIGGYDVLFMVLGGKPWQEKDSLNVIRKYRNIPGIVFVTSMEDRRQSEKMALMSGQKIYMLPRESDPFSPSKSTVRAFRQMLNY